MTPTRRRICKSLVRRNYQSFAKKCVQNVVSRKTLVKIVGCTLTKEVAAMCSKKFNSLLRAKDNESMLKFKFGTVMSELRNQAPTLLTLLQSCMKTRTPRANYQLIIVMIDDDLQALRLQMFACTQNFICDHVCRAFGQTGMYLMYSIESFSTCFGCIY